MRLAFVSLASPPAAIVNECVGPRGPGCGTVARVGGAA